jgi:membrane protease YdiL (CAAX protease family)
MSNDFWMAAAVGGSIAIAAVLGVFRPRRIIGRERLGPEESPRLLSIALLLGMLAWFLGSTMISELRSWNLRRHHEPADAQLSGAETVVYSGLMEGAVLAAMVLGTAALRPKWIEKMGLEPRRLPGGIAVGVVAIGLALPSILLLNGAVEWTLEHFNKEHGPHPLLELLKENPPPWLTAADTICAGFVAPVAEEFFFRGLLLTLLRSVFRQSWPAILLSAAAFALVHPSWSWVQIFFLGVCLGYVYERSGNLWMSITMHSTFNLLSIWLFTHFGG